MATTKKTAAKKTVSDSAVDMKFTTKKAAAKKSPAKKTVEKAAKKAAPAKKESKMKELKVGDPVLVRVDPRLNGGSDVAAGQVTKAGKDVANVRVVLDSEENQWLRDVAVVKSQPEEGDEVSGRVCWPA